MPLPYKRVDLQFSNQSSEDWFVHDFPLQQAWLGFGATSTIHYRTQLLLFAMVKHAHYNTPNK